MHSRTAAGLLAWLVIPAGCTLMVPPEEDPLYLRTTEMDNRLTRVERLIENEGLMTLLARLDMLQQDVQGLRNDVETLQHEVEQANGRQRDLYLDVDERLQAIEKATVAAVGLTVSQGASLSPGQLPVPGGTDRENYQAAFDLLKQGQYDQAASGFQQFLVVFPVSDLSGNAQYWLAETHYVSQKYQEALAGFQVLLDTYPDSRKIPDALLKIGYCNYELGLWDASRVALTAVVQDYPETTAARLADQRLDRIKGEGH